VTDCFILPATPGTLPATRVLADNDSLNTVILWVGSTFVTSAVSRLLPAYLLPEIGDESRIGDNSYDEFQTGVRTTGVLRLVFSFARAQANYRSALLTWSVSVTQDLATFY